MAINCDPVSVEEVIKFFEDDIDGMGKHGSHPRNSGISDSIRSFQNWEFGELTHEELMFLIIPDGSQMLIKDKGALEGFTKINVEARVQELKTGKSLDPLIITEPEPGEGPANSSFYIKDGSKRAIALKIYFENNPYTTIKAYIGKKSS